MIFAGLLGPPASVDFGGEGCDLFGGARLSTLLLTKCSGNLKIDGTASFFKYRLPKVWEYGWVGKY